VSRLIIDIGGTNLRYEIYGDMVESGVYSSRDISLDDFLEHTLSSNPDIEGVGISFAGYIKDSYIIDSPNIRIDRSDIADYISRKYHIPVIIENDLNSAAIAEANFFNSKYLIAIYSGTGIGAGIVSNGKILSGIDGFAGEIGHIPYRDADFRCGCGRYNCIENWASGRAISMWSKIYSCSGSSLAELRESDSEKCRRVYLSYLDALSRACGTVITLFNPEVLVLGGGVISANPWIVDILKERLRDDTLSVSLNSCKIELTRLKNAGLEGIKILLDSSIS